MMDSLLRDRLSLLAAVGCGVAFGVSGIYSYYKTNRQLNRQITQLTDTIEELKKEVHQLRIESRAASQVHSPIHENFFHFNPESSGYHPISEVDAYSNDFRFNPGLNANLADHKSISTDDNEEFYDFTEG